VYAGPPLPDVLDLAHAQEIALSGHPSIAHAEARVRQAQERFHIVRSTFLPSVGVKGSWTRSDLPDRLFESSLPSVDETRAEFNTARGNRQPGDGIESFLNSPYDDARDALADGELGPFLFEHRGDSVQPIIPESDLRQLQAFLQNQQGLSEADAQDVADSLRASYLESTIGDTPETYWAGAQASWQVFGGFSRMFRRSAAIHGKQQTLASKRDAERLLLGGVAAVFYQAQYAREQLAIAQGDLDFSERMLTEATRGKESGMKSEDDVLDARVRRNSAESSRIEAERQYKLSLSALAAVMALPEDGLPESVQLAPLPAPNDQELAAPNVEGEITYALLNRPDLAASRFSAAARRDQKGVARSTFYPDVWLTGGYDGTRHEDYNFEESDFGWNVSVIASLDIFRGGARLASVSERIAAMAAAEADVHQHELDAMTDVRNAVSTLASSGKQLQLQTENLSLVERFRDLTDMEYQSGTVPAIKLYDAQHRFVSAQSRHTSALVALHAAWQSLQQATARSLAQEYRPKKESNDQP
jgi:outer membrane protein TolC